MTRSPPAARWRRPCWRKGALEAREVIRLAQGLCQALVAIHAAEVIHRDFKPSNVMLVDGDPLVIDFGIAHLVNATRLTQTGMFVGTPGYLAPEIIRDSEITQAADVHALASTVFFAATGAPPFGTGTFEAVCFNIMEGRAQIDKAPAWLRGWLSRALRVEPAARPGAQELLRMARALDPSVTSFHETSADGPTGTKRMGNRTRVMENYSDLLPPVAYGDPRPRRRAEEYAAAAREERPPPYVSRRRCRTGPAAPRVRPAGRGLCGAADPPPPAYRPATQARSASRGRASSGRPRRRAPYTPPAERKRYLVGSQFVGLLLLVTLAALAVMLPVAVSAVAVALALVLRVGEYLFGDMVKRRQVRGSSAADPLLVLVGTPWALVKAALVTLVHVPLALMFGVCVWGVLRWGGGMSVNAAAAYARGRLHGRAVRAAGRRRAAQGGHALAHRHPAHARRGPGRRPDRRYGRDARGDVRDGPEPVVGALAGSGDRDQRADQRRAAEHDGLDHRPDRRSARRRGMGFLSPWS